MQNMLLSIETLRGRISAIETLLRELKQELSSLEEQNSSSNPPHPGLSPDDGFHATGSKNQDEYTESSRAFSLEEYQRYGRQMIMPEVGMAGKCRTILFASNMYKGCSINGSRTKCSQGEVGIDHWTRRSRMSCSSIPQRCWCWPHRSHRWGHRRGFKFTPTDSSHHQQHRHVQSQQRCAIFEKVNPV